MDADAYARQLRQLLPRGRAWQFDATSWLAKAMLAIGDGLARLDQRVQDFLNESDPRTATETLSDWESALGLPDGRVTSIPATIAGRRAAIVQKLTGRGGQSRAYLIALAASCGYTATITEFTVMRVGARVNDRVYDATFAYSFQMVVSAVSGDALPRADFERVIRHVAPAHVQVGFVYP